MRIGVGSLVDSPADRHYSTEYIRSVELCRRNPSVDLGERADKFFGNPGIFTALAREARTDTSPPVPRPIPATQRPAVNTPLTHAAPAS